MEYRVEINGNSSVVRYHDEDIEAVFLPLLQRLKAEGFKLAVVSNKADALMQKICSRFFGGSSTLLLVGGIRCCSGTHSAILICPCRAVFLFVLAIGAFP